MFRRIFALLSTVVVAVSLTAPAVADSTPSWQKVAGLTNQNWLGGPHKTVYLPDGTAVLLQFEYPCCGNPFLGARTISKAGVLSDTVVISTSPGQSFSQSKTFSVAVTPAGTVAVTWSWQVMNQDNSVTSSIYVAFSQDGLNWSNPVQPLAPVTSTGFCDFIFITCGYVNPQMATDGRGRMAILVANATSDSNLQLLAVSSMDGLVWTSPTLVDSSLDAIDWQFDSQHKVVLRGLPSGFVAAYQVRLQDSTTQIKVVQMPPGDIPYWLPPKVVEATAWGFDQTINYASNGDLLLTWWRFQQSDVYMMEYSKYSVAQKSWSTPATITTTAAQSDVGQLTDQETSYQGVNSSIIWIEHANNVNDVLRTVLVLNGVVGTPITVAAPTTAVTTDTSLLGVNLNPDGSTTVGLLSRNLNNASLLDVSSSGSLSVSPLAYDAGLYGWSDLLSFNNEGDIVYREIFSPGGPLSENFWTLTRSAAPVPAAAVTIKGTSKVGQKLAAQLPVFASISGTGTTTVQWYSCTKQVKTAPLTLPKTCKPVKKATTSSYKLVKGDAKKYVLVSATNANAVGSTTIYSASTKVVK